MRSFSRIKQKTEILLWISALQVVPVSPAFMQIYIIQVKFYEILNCQPFEMSKNKETNIHLTIKAMKVKSKISAFLVVTTLVVAFSMPRQVQGQNQAAPAKEIQSRPHNMQKGPFANITGLTDVQKTKIKDLMYERNKDKQMMKAQLAEKKAHLLTLTLADAPDRNAINKTIDEMSALQGNMMKNSIDMKFNIKSVLTPDQYKEWEMHGQQAKLKNQRGKGQGNMAMSGNKMQRRNNRGTDSQYTRQAETPNANQNN